MASEHAKAKALRASVAQLEQKLKASIYSKSSRSMNEQRTLDAAFRKIDVDGTDSIDYDEFVDALERFGLVVAGRRPGVGGVSPEAAKALFDSYDADGSGCISSKEFSARLFAEPPPPPPPPPAPAPSSERLAEWAGGLDPRRRPSARGQPSEPPPARTVRLDINGERAKKIAELRRAMSSEERSMGDVLFKDNLVRRGLSEEELEEAMKPISCAKWALMMQAVKQKRGFDFFNGPDSLTDFRF